MKILLGIPHFITLIGLKKVLTEAFENANINTIESKSDLYNNTSFDSIDLIILDTELKSSTLKQYLKLIKEKNPEAKVLIFGNKRSQHLEFHFIALGASGFICKGCSKNELITAINMITKGNLYISENAVHNNMLHSKNGMYINEPGTILSKREKEVFKYLIDGMGINQICEEVQLKQATVSTLKRRIFEKYNVSNVIDLYKIASIHGYN